ncbi:MAG: hypothetical protein K6T83_11400 [Alicyclobacillus sp.]|nr:hypothetical protein [Alicyclobacillus sp.]
MDHLVRLLVARANGETLSMTEEAVKPQGQAAILHGPQWHRGPAEAEGCGRVDAGAHASSTRRAAVGEARATGVGEIAPYCGIGPVLGEVSTIEA